MSETLVHGHKNAPLHGGVLVENIVQAIARDILVEAISTVERQGWPVYLHVHDEIVCHVPTEKADDCLKAVDLAIATPPAWANGLCLAAEGVKLTDLNK